MSERLYRIKLYGHSSGDPDFFVVELAAVLEIDPESARALLQSTPVVIKEGITLPEAEHLEGLLNVIKALFIVEPTEEYADPAQSGAESGTPIEILKQELEDKERKKNLRSYIWLGVASLSGIVIAASLIGSFISSYSRSSLQNRTKLPVVKETVKEKSSEESLLSSAPAKADLSELYRQMEISEQKIQEMEFQLGLAQQELQKLYSTYRADSGLIREKRLAVADAGRKLGIEKKAFKELKSQADAIEATLK